ncbi:MAG: cytidylate kinase-like family protein [Anaerolineae bacterium]|nr:cytidylate kinase-like family protein [Anaerolineae bacterium]
MTVITVSRQLGSGGDEIATQVCERLGYQFFNKEMMIEAASDVGLRAEEVVDFSEDRYDVQNFLERLLRSRARQVKQVLVRDDDHKVIDTLNARTLNEAQCVDLVRYTVLTAYETGNFVIVGRGGQAILRDKPNTLHVRVVAPLEQRIQHIRTGGMSGISEIKLAIERHDRAAAEYLDRFFGITWDDPANYHLVINGNMMPVRAAVEVIVAAAEAIQATASV